MLLTVVSGLRFFRISALIDEMKELEELRLQENRQAALESEAREADRQLDMRREQDR